MNLILTYVLLTFSILGRAFVPERISIDNILTNLAVIRPAVERNCLDGIASEGRGFPIRQFQVNEGVDRFAFTLDPDAIPYPRLSEFVFVAGISQQARAHLLQAFTEPRGIPAPAVFSFDFISRGILRVVWMSNKSGLTSRGYPNHAVVKFYSIDEEDNLKLSELPLKYRRIRAFSKNVYLVESEEKNRSGFEFYWVDPVKGVMELIPTGEAALSQAERYEALFDTAANLHTEVDFSQVVVIPTQVRRNETWENIRVGVSRQGWVVLKQADIGVTTYSVNGSFKSRTFRPRPGQLSLISTESGRVTLTWDLPQEYLGRVTRVKGGYLTESFNPIYLSGKGSVETVETGEVLFYGIGREGWLGLSANRELIRVRLP